jgi:hypothetical protein
VNANDTNFRVEARNMTRRFDFAWWLWLFTGLALGASLAGWAPGLPAAIVLTALQVVHQGVRARNLSALPVQVRAAYLSLLLLGIWPPLRVLHPLQLAGTVALVVFDYCPLARLLALMPWNRRRPFTFALVRSTFLSAPVRGSILDR